MKKLIVFCIAAMSFNCANFKQYNCPDVIAPEVEIAMNDWCDSVGECYIRTPNSGLTFLLEKKDHYAGYYNNRLFSDRIYIDPAKVPNKQKLLAIILHETGHAFGLYHDISIYKTVMRELISDNEHPLQFKVTCHDKQMYFLSKGMPEPDCTPEVW